MPDNLSLGPVNGTTQQIDISGGGTSVVLPSATTSDAGLMSAADKVKVKNSILQGGNAFTGTPVNIGTTNGESLNFFTNANLKAWFDVTTPNFYVVALANQNTVNNSLITLANAGTVISRNVSDANPALKVDLVNASSTANIQSWYSSGALKAYVNKNGEGSFTRMALGSGLGSPNYLLDIDAGTVAASTVLGSFAQNNGYVRISNFSTAASTFVPLIKTAVVNNSVGGLSFAVSGSNGYSAAAYSFNALNAVGLGAPTSGNLFSIDAFGVPKFIVDYQGVVKIPNLGGTGTRIVTADSTGVTSTVASIPVANGGTGLTSAGTNGQILVSDGTGFVLTTPPDIVSGTYTPTVTVGVGTVTPSGFTFMKIKDVVNVNGLIDCSGIISGVNDLKVTLPVASVFTANEQLNGVITGTDLKAASPNYVLGDSNTGEAHVSFHAVGGTATIYIQFQYQVL